MSIILQELPGNIFTLVVETWTQYWERGLIKFNSLTYHINGKRVRIGPHRGTYLTSFCEQKREQRPGS